MRTISLCGKHKRRDGFCAECEIIYKEMQGRNPCNTCESHTNDEICSWHSSCKERSVYEKWRNSNGYNPQYDPDTAKSLQEARLLD